MWTLCTLAGGRPGWRSIAAATNGPRATGTAVASSAPNSTRIGMRTGSESETPRNNDAYHLALEQTLRPRRVRAQGGCDGFRSLLQEIQEHGIRPFSALFKWSSCHHRPAAGARGLCRVHPSFRTCRCLYVVPRACLCVRVRYVLLCASASVCLCLPLCPPPPPLPPPPPPPFLSLP